MDLEANRHHLWVITISIITSLLLHLMICFAKGITFWIWVCTMGVGGQAEINQADVFLLPSICFLKKCAWWCSCWPMIILPGVWGLSLGLMWAPRQYSKSEPIFNALCRAPISYQQCAEMWRRCDECNPNRCLSCRAKLKRSEPNWSPAKQVASEGPAEIHRMFMNWT